MNQVKNQISGMKKLMQKASDRLLLCKSKLQQVGISVNDHKKVKPVSQGTQIDKDLEITDVTPANILEIPEDETDVATKALIAEMEGKEPNVATSQNASILGQNFTITASSTSSVPGSATNIVSLLSMTQNASNYIITMQKTGSSVLVTPQHMVQQGIIPQKSYNSNKELFKYHQELLYKIVYLCQMYQKDIRKPNFLIHLKR